MSIFITEIYFTSQLPYFLQLHFTFSFYYRNVIQTGFVNFNFNTYVTSFFQAYY